MNGLHRCGSCGLWFAMLVDDGDLCLVCDSLHFPTRTHVWPVAS